MSKLILRHKGGSKPWAVLRVEDQGFTIPVGNYLTAKNAFIKKQVTLDEHAMNDIRAHEPKFFDYLEKVKRIKL